MSDYRKDLVLYMAACVAYYTIQNGCVYQRVEGRLVLDRKYMGDYDSLYDLLASKHKGAISLINTEEGIYDY